MIQVSTKTKADNTKVFLITDESQLDLLSKVLSPDNLALAKKLLSSGKNLFYLNLKNSMAFIHRIELKNDSQLNKENFRKGACSLVSELKSMKSLAVEIIASVSKDLTLAYAEGILLSAYSFDKYFTKKDDSAKLTKLSVIQKEVNQADLDLLSVIAESSAITKDLVNEPVITLGAQELSEEIKKLGKKNGFKVDVLNKQKIESLKMGGLLGVNAGSVNPPTFNILEWKPKNAKNKKPIVLVGKGVVYDTGGLSLKPTAGSMDTMKCDMAGAATVIGVFNAISKLELPLYVVGLIPATDNRPGGNAITPGDVITISDGTTVEVLNTDAEGRLILSDALVYAQKYKPELVFDYATLTGAAARAIGHQAIVFMGTAGKEVKEKVVSSSWNTYERLVEFPIWDDYKEMLKSDIADMKNISGGASSGAITAGKFLEHFTNYPWLHFDIAGPAFLTFQDSYRGKNATAIGVRLTIDFLMNY